MTCLAALIAGGLVMQSAAAVVPVRLGADPPSAITRPRAMDCRLRRLSLSRAPARTRTYRVTISIDPRTDTVRADGVVEGTVIALRFKISRQTDTALVAHTLPTQSGRPVAFVYEKQGRRMTLGPLTVRGQSWALVGECNGTQ